MPIRRRDTNAQATATPTDESSVAPGTIDPAPSAQDLLPQAPTSPRSGSPDRPLMTAADAQSVRFDRSRPEGYFFPQVEQFVHETFRVLLAHEQSHAERDAYEERLRSEYLDEVNENARLRTELQLFSVQGVALRNPDGTYVRESDVAAAPIDPTESEARLLAERDHLANEMRSALNDLAVARADRDQAISRAQEMSAFAAQVGDDLARAKAALEANAAQLAQQQIYIDQLRAELAQAMARTEASRTTPQAPATAATPVAWDAPYDDEPTEPQPQTSPGLAPIDLLTDDGPRPHLASREPVPSTARAAEPGSPVASHGTQHVTVVPAPAEAAPAGLSDDINDSYDPLGESPMYEYRDATPGEPLSTNGVPLGIWAPELAPTQPQPVTPEVEDDGVPFGVTADTESHRPTDGAD